MAIEHLQRIVIANGSGAAVEAETAALAEIVLGRDTATGAIGYSVDAGAAWVWLPETGHTHTQSDITDLSVTNQYRRMLYAVVGGTITFLTQPDGYPLTVLVDTE